MASAGVPRLVIGKVLNHVEHGVTAVYDRHSYDGEKRAALDTWARDLGVCAAGDLRHANGSPAHDLSHVSGRLRRSAGRGGFSVVGEQMTKFGPRGPHGPPETAMRIDLSPL